MYSRKSSEEGPTVQIDELTVNKGGVGISVVNQFVRGAAPPAIGSYIAYVSVTNSLAWLVIGFLAGVLITIMGSSRSKTIGRSISTTVMIAGSGTTVLIASAPTLISYNNSERQKQSVGEDSAEVDTSLSSREAALKSKTTAGSACRCFDGTCCDGCEFLSSSQVCQARAETQYECAWGTSCGSDVGVRFRSRHCSGTSAACDGDMGPWTPFQVAAQCSDIQSCYQGDSSCKDGNAECGCIFRVATHHCPTYSEADGHGSGGGEIMKVCGSLRDNRNAGLTVSVLKYDGTPFGDRPYQLRSVDSTDSADLPCGPKSSHYRIVDDEPDGKGTSELRLGVYKEWKEWDRLEKERAYCVTASVQNGDLGYNPLDKEQAAWWWSDKIVIERVCAPGARPPLDHE